MEITLDTSHVMSCARGDIKIESIFFTAREPPLGHVKQVLALTRVIIDL